jgi:hypothetical protein
MFAQFQKNIDKKAIYTKKGFTPNVIIKDVRLNYGRYQYMIKPDNNENNAMNFKWVYPSSLEIQD